MGTLWQDMRFAMRTLCKKPGFTAVVILTLALGIGANTAIFSLIYGVLLRPFPYREPDRLVKVESVYTKTTGVVRGCSLLDIEDWRRMNQTLIEIGAHTTFDADVRGDGPSEPVRMTQLNDGAMSSLGVNPVIGRLFLPEEDRKGGDVHKALISHRLWQQRFGGRPDIVGRTLQTTLGDFTIVGVMPPGFRFPENTEVWTPMESWYAMSYGSYLYRKRDSRWYATIARLKPGVTIERAQADLNKLAIALEQQFPKENEGVRVRLTPLRDAEVGNIRPYLLMLLAAVGFVLLICCANAASLLLAQAAAGRREFAVRAALGASRARIVRELLVRSSLLALLGAFCGVALAVVGVKALLALIPVQLPFWMRIEVDAPALFFSLGVAALTSLLFGIAPALLASRAPLNDALRSSAKGSSGGAKVRSVLVVMQIALCLLLLVGAGLMIQTFLRLQRLDPGFNPDRVVVVRATNFRNGMRAERATAMAEHHERALALFRSLPGVVSVAATNSLPYGRVQTERSKTELIIKGRSSEELKHQVALAGADVSAGYFETMRIPLVRGRLFDARDTKDSPMVLIISERAAQTLFPGRDPIGQEILWGAQTVENPFCTVVGVVGNVRHQATEDDKSLELYYPYTQYPVTNAYYVLRMQSDPGPLMQTVRETINRADPKTAIVFVKTMDQLIGESLWQRRLWGVIFAVFSTLALTLAAVGIYGVLAYSTQQRTREIGVRIALGAEAGDVLRMVLAHGLRLALGGIGIGLLGALGLSRLIGGLLYGVKAWDPLTYVGVALLLVLVTLIACWLPARRAAMTDPLMALRNE
jgi:putative ABC transport system permease protein